MVTIKDIALEAGVSKSTVSRVLTKGYVKEETRERIQKVMEKYGFQPSASARSLSSQKSNTIGVIVPELGNPFYREVLEGVVKVVEQQKLTLIYCNTNNNALQEMDALAMLESQRVRGMIMAPAVDYINESASKQVISLMSKLNAPVVLVDRNIEGHHFDSVIYDNYGSAFCATEHLILGGCKHIGVITCGMNLEIHRKRFEGYLSALEKYGIPREDQYICYGGYSAQTAYQLSCQLLDAPTRPDGVMCCNNYTTLGFIRAVRERGMKLGREIAMVGIDHVDVLDTIGYQYSCVTRDTEMMGRLAMELLVERMDDPDGERKSLIIPYISRMDGTETKRGLKPLNGGK